MMVTPGNHEYNAVNYFAQFAHPNNEYWYTFRYGNVQIVAVNDTEGLFSIGSNPALTKSTIRTTQLDFIDETFGSTDRLWKMMFHHRPMYSSSTKFLHGSNVDLQNNWAPLMDEHGVNFVFAGHDHHYERCCPIRNDRCEANPNDGTIFMTSAGGGSGLYDSTPQWFTEQSERVHHYVMVTIEGRDIEIEAIDIDGNTIDNYQYTLQ
jgi:3',5'-cyclic AMP phosphodiesterase CpdA